MMQRQVVGLMLCLLFSAGSLLAADQNQGTAWLYDFFSRGIKSANAEYSFKIAPVASNSTVYYQEKYCSAEYDALKQYYQFRYKHEYREDWQILTHQGTTIPPQIQPAYVGSKVQPWTNQKGIGNYQELYERQYPNWSHWNSFDSICMNYFKIPNQLPVLSGIFFEDELKTLRKLAKEDSYRDNALLTCFEFDHSGHMHQMSDEYLNELKNTDLANKNIEEYTITLRNRSEQVVFIDVISGGVQIIEGLLFISGEKRSRVFNFELNAMLHKFVPDLVDDPQVLINNYIQDLQSFSGTSFARFETSVSR